MLLCEPEDHLVTYEDTKMLLKFKLEKVSKCHVIAAYLENILQVL